MSISPRQFGVRLAWIGASAVGLVTWVEWMLSFPLWLMACGSLLFSAILLPQLLTTFRAYASAPVDQRLEAVRASGPTFLGALRLIAGLVFLSAGTALAAGGLLAPGFVFAAVGVFLLFDLLRRFQKKYGHHRGTTHGE